MSGLVYLGRIAGPGEDVFPTTGPHLDVRVTPQFGSQKGKRVNPETARTLLQNVLVGDKQTPLVQQQGDQWKWNFPITSRFGPRSAPTAGASTYHQGIDLGIGPENIAYKGTGSFKPGKGYGTLTTTDPQGNPYEIQFLHTKPAVENALASAVAPAQSTPESTSSRTEDILKAFLYGAQMQGEKKPEKSMKQQLKEQVVGGLISQAMNPMGFLSSFASSDPLLGGQAAATNDYLMGLFG
jgi:hypothetical protein